MSNKPVTGCEARLEIFIARPALDALKAHDTSLDADAPLPFIQPIAESIADIAGALKTLRAFVAQQDPDGEVELRGKTLSKGLDPHL